MLHVGKQQHHRLAHITYAGMDPHHNVQNLRSIISWWLLWHPPQMDYGGIAMSVGTNLPDLHEKPTTRPMANEE